MQVSRYSFGKKNKLLLPLTVLTPSGKLFEPLAVVHARPVRPGFMWEPSAAGHSEALLDTQSLCISVELGNKYVNFYLKTCSILIVIALKNELLSNIVLHPIKPLLLFVFFFRQCLVVISDMPC